jgi:hypothetical protein
MRPTIHRHGLEFFSISRSFRNFGWTRDLADASLVNGMALCRESVGTYSYHHSLVRLTKNFVGFEAPIGASPTRLQYAIAAIAGTPARFSIRTVDDQTILEFNNSIPRAEFRLIEALGARQERKFGCRRYLVDAELVPVLLERMSALGCERID